MINTVQISPDEIVMHFGAVKIRVNGTGNLIPTLYSLDNARSKELKPFVMEAFPGLEPTKLTNFVSQRAFLKLETRELDEIFKINRIIVYVKPIWNQFSGK